MLDGCVAYFYQQSESFENIIYVSIQLKVSVLKHIPFLHWFINRLFLASSINLIYNFAIIVSIET